MYLLASFGFLSFFYIDLNIFLSYLTACEWHLQRHACLQDKMNTDNFINKEIMFLTKKEKKKKRDSFKCCCIFQQEKIVIRQF